MNLSNHRSEINYNKMDEKKGNQETTEINTDIKLRRLQSDI